MSDLCKDTGRILFVIRLFLFIFLISTVLFCDSVKKYRDFAGVNSVRSQYGLMLGFCCSIPEIIVCGISPAGNRNTETRRFHQKVHPYTLQSIAGTLMNDYITPYNMTFDVRTEDHFILHLQT